jgi:uncharacterized protein YbaP (TraB family)
MKRILSSVLVAVCLLISTISIPVLAKSVTKTQPISVQIDGKRIAWEGKALPRLMKETVFLPLRQAVALIKGQSRWDAKANAIAVTIGSDEYIIPLDSAEAKKNGKPITLMATAQQINGQSYVPIRLFQTLFGYAVAYDAKSRTVTIESPTKNTVVRNNTSPSQGFLWEVKSGKNKMFLLGSIHIGDWELYPLRKEIEESYAQSTHLVVEVDITKSDPAKTQQTIANVGMFKEDMTLKQTLDTKRYATLYEFLNPFGIKEGALDMYKPWFVSVQLEGLKAMKNGLNPQFGIDSYYIAKAQKDKKTIVELETAEQQLTLLSGGSIEDQKKALDYAIDHIHEDRSKEMLAIWKKGDEAGATKITEQARIADPQAYKKIFDARDQAMAEKLVTALQSTTPATYFVVVGAGHMIGARGIDALLQEKGFEVIRK